MTKVLVWVFALLPLVSLAQENTNYKTKDNVEISSIENLFCEQTYNGLLLGFPNKRITNIEMQNFFQTVKILNFSEDESIYDKYIYTMQPTLIKDKIGVNEFLRLPRYACSSRLISEIVISDKKKLFSMLILIFYQEENPMLNGVNYNSILKLIIWRSIAQDTDI